jgi:hypothetical protein
MTFYVPGIGFFRAADEFLYLANNLRLKTVKVAKMDRAFISVQP